MFFRPGMTLLYPLERERERVCAREREKFIDNQAVRERERDGGRERERRV